MAVKKKKDAGSIAKVTLRFCGRVLEITLYNSKQYQNRPKRDLPSTYQLPPGLYC